MRNQPVSLSLLLRQFMSAPYCFSTSAIFLLRGLFVSPSCFHLSEKPLSLQLFLQDSESLLNVIVANQYLQSCSLVVFRFLGFRNPSFGRSTQKLMLKATIEIKINATAKTSTIARIRMGPKVYLSVLISERRIESIVP